MEVKEASAVYLRTTGYKQTEVGMIPEDWGTPTLGALFLFKNGLNKSKEFFGYGKPIVNYMDVYRYPGLLVRDLRGLVDVSRQELDAFGVRRGDVFFTRTSETVEEIGIASVLLEDSPDTVFSGFVLRARPKNDVLLDQYKKYCFSSSAVRIQIISKSTYTTRALTNGRVLAGVVLPLPPTKVEQEAIAEALSDADAFIESLSLLLAKKRHLKQGAMQELLTGKKRLPGFCGEWEVKWLGEICSMKSGEGITSASIDGHSTFPCYGGNGLRGYTKRYTHDGKHALIGRVGALCGNVIDVEGKFFASEHAIVVMSLNETDIHWLALVLRSMNLNKYSEASAQPVLTVTKLLAIPVRVPLPHEQTAIAAILSDMDIDLAALEAKLAKARSLKQGMMQELLTGRIRLV